MRSLLRRTTAARGVFLAVVCTGLLTAAPAAQDPAALSLVGRLATVEPANRRLTVVPVDSAEIVEVFAAADVQVTQENRRLTLAELVIQVGRRVTVTYRLAGDDRLAERIIVEADQ